MRDIFKAHFMATFVRDEDGGGRAATKQRSHVVNVPVDGMASLEESLLRLTAEEDPGKDGDSSDEEAVPGAGAEAPQVRRCRFRAPPQHLMLHLKRYRFDQEEGVSKITSRFTFPTCLDLGPYTVDGSSPATYELTGVILHQGSATGGHYWSLVRHGSEWIELNDEAVQPLDEKQIDRLSFGGTEGLQTPCAMMLCYSSKTAPSAPEIPQGGPFLLCLWCSQQTSCASV